MTSAVGVRPYNLTLYYHDAASGRLLDVQRTHNRVTNSGLAVQALWGAGRGSPITTFGAGTDSTPVQATDTALGAEVYSAEVARLNPSGATLDVQFYISSASANGSTLCEYGLYAGDTLYARAVVEGRAKTSDITITGVWQISWAAEV